jgi:hypothetical protein
LQVNHAYVRNPVKSESLFLIRDPSFMNDPAFQAAVPTWRDDWGEPGSGLNSLKEKLKKMAPRRVVENYNVRGGVIFFLR